MVPVTQLCSILRLLESKVLLVDTVGQQSQLAPPLSLSLRFVCRIPVLLFTGLVQIRSVIP
jgi:hypothetical protein